MNLRTGTDINSPESGPLVGRRTYLLTKRSVDSKPEPAIVLLYRA